MKTLAHHIQNARMQPMHIRKQIAFTSAFVGAAIVAMLWLGINLATGVFALDMPGTEPANLAATAASSGSNTSLLGSVAAAFSGTSQTPAHVDVVDTGTQTSVNAPKVTPAPEPTVIPF